MNNDKQKRSEHPLEVSDSELAAGIAPNDVDKTTSKEGTDEFDANDGMTATSARKSGGGDEHTPHTDASYDPSTHPGQEFNINDQAYSQSSKEDYIKTISGFSHSDGSKSTSKDDSAGQDPK